MTISMEYFSYGVGFVMCGWVAGVVISVIFSTLLQAPQAFKR